MTEASDRFILKFTHIPILEKPIQLEARKQGLE
jgi:hypothetical protein